MPDFVNLGPAVDVYAPDDRPDSLHVASGQTITVPGAITSELEDAYLVGTSDAARLWPKNQWQLKQPPAPAKTKQAAPAADSKEATS